MVLPAAGMGTRLLPATKEQPKEMLPIFSGDGNGSLCVKPVINLVFDQLYGKGFRRFCFIVGRGKRVIEDYFTRDNGYTQMLHVKDKSSHACDLEGFYSRLDDSSLMWVNQPEPRGFGDAVLRAKHFVGSDPFLVHAGDTVIISKRDDDYLSRLMKIWRDLRPDAAFVVKTVKDTRSFGVIQGKETVKGVFKVDRVVEKPKKHISDLAIMPVYLFKPNIFEALENVTPDRRGEIQLTDAIQELIKQNLKVVAVKLRADDMWLDIGSSETYWDALNKSYKRVSKRR